LICYRFANHENSKKHKESVAVLKSYMEEEEEEENAQNGHDSAKEETEGGEAELDVEELSESSEEGICWI
jgi:hypothetical protein